VFRVLCGFGPKQNFSSSTKIQNHSFLWNFYYIPIQAFHLCDELIKACKSLYGARKVNFFAIYAFQTRTINGIHDSGELFLANNEFFFTLSHQSLT
jgi:hypothetical protein